MTRILRAYAILLSLAATGVLTGMIAVAAVDIAGCAGGCKIASGGLDPLFSAAIIDCGNCD